MSHELQDDHAVRDHDGAACADAADHDGARAPSRPVPPLLDAPANGGSEVPLALLERQDVLKYVAHEAAERSTLALQRGNGQWRLLWTSMIAVVGFLGYRNAADVIAGPVQKELVASLDRKGEDFDRRIDTRMAAISTGVSAAQQKLKDDLRVIVEEDSAALRVRLDRVEGELQTGLSLVALKSLALDLEQKDSFSHAERDVVMDQLSKVVLSDEIRAGAEFGVVLAQVLNSFTAAGLNDYIDRIDALTGDVAQRDAQASLIMTLHYGQRLIGDVLGADGWAAEDVARFERYANAARNNGEVGPTLGLELLVEFLRSGSAPTAGIERLVRSATYQDPMEQARFHLAVIQYTGSEYWTLRATAQTDRIASVTRDFVRTYARELDEVLSGSAEARSLLEQQALIYGQSFPFPMNAALDGRTNSERRFADAIKLALERGYGALAEGEER